MEQTALTKVELLAWIRKSHGLLENKYARLSPAQMECPASMGDWSVKDILAHLADWEQRFTSWYQAGVRGEVPVTPEPGFTWKDLARLNQIGYEKHKDQTLEVVLAWYEKSYLDTYALIEGMSEQEICEPGVYAWTGKTPLLPWIASNTSKHYEWAVKNIKIETIRKACGR
jgi:hypothetical protein